MTKIFFGNKILTENVLGRIFFVVNKILSENKFGLKKNLIEMFFGRNKIWIEFFGTNIKFGSKFVLAGGKIWVKKKFGQKKFG